MLKDFFRDVYSGFRDAKIDHDNTVKHQESTKKKLDPSDLRKYRQTFDNTYNKKLGLEYFRYTFKNISKDNWQIDIDNFYEKIRKQSDDDKADDCYFAVYGAFEYFFCELAPHEKNICMYVDNMLSNQFTSDERIIEFIIKNEGIKQTDLYKNFPNINKSSLSATLVLLAEDNVITRIKSGNTYTLSFNKLEKNPSYPNYRNEFIKISFIVKDNYTVL